MSDSAAAPDRRFSIDLAVRDYECDLQGIVNHARYLHYLEHARHEFLKARGHDFAALTAQGIILVVTRVEVDYRWPLRSGDRFSVELGLRRVSRLRFGFDQRIRRADGKLCVEALVIGTALDRAGRPSLPAALESLWGPAPATGRDAS